MQHKTRNPILWALLLVVVLLAVPAAEAATVTIINLDAGTGAGLDDPTPVAPVGNNPGTTLGQQRLNVFQRAGNIWGLLLNSNVNITVQATFTPLACTSTSATLGAAGALSVSASFPGAVFANTWYHAALANALAGADQDPANDDIIAFFNSNLGNPGCLTGVNWYYGFDNVPPGGDIDFLTVILHEMGHGLGFSSFVDETTGALLGPPFLNDVWNHFLLDATSGLLWRSMTNAQRAASAVNTGNLVWRGANVSAASGILTSGINPATGLVRMYAPNPVQPGSSVSHWDTVLAPNEMMEPFLSLSTDDPSLGVPLMADIAWSTNPQNYWIYDPVPGTAGFNNLFSATNGTPGATTFLIYGTIAGPLAVPGCPGVFVGMTDPVVLTSGPNDAAGNFDFTLFLGGGVSGVSVLMQAVELSTCTVSNLINPTF
jgi:hypothetical protein